MKKPRLAAGFAFIVMAMKKIALLALLAFPFGFAQRQLSAGHPLVGALRGVLSISEPAGYYLPGYGYHIVLRGNAIQALPEYADLIRTATEAFKGEVSLKDGEVIAVGFYNSLFASEFEVLVVFRGDEVETWIDGERR